MSQHGKRYTRGAREPDRPRARLHAARGRPAPQGRSGREVRRDGRGALQPRAQRPPRRPAAARDADAPARHGQGRPHRRLRRGREGPGGRGGRRRRRRLRRSRREDRGGLRRLRRRHRDAGHDGHGRQARPDPRPAREDAEPEDRGRSPSTSARPCARRRPGKLEYRTDRGANVHLVIGSKSFDERTLLENYATVVEEIVRAKPAAAKGRYIRSITLTSSMGPGIHVDPARTREIAAELEEEPQASRVEFVHTPVAEDSRQPSRA